MYARIEIVVALLSLSLFHVFLVTTRHNQVGLARKSDAFFLTSLPDLSKTLKTKENSKNVFCFLYWSPIAAGCSLKVVRAFMLKVLQSCKTSIEIRQYVPDRVCYRPALFFRKASKAFYLNNRKSQGDSQENNGSSWFVWHCLVTY